LLLTLPLAVVVLFSRPAGAQQYSITDLGTLGGTTSSGGGISASGEVTGYAYTIPDATGFYSIYAFMYAPGGPMTSLGDPFVGVVTPGSEGFAINASGQVTGGALAAPDMNGVETFHAFLYSGGAMIDLGTLAGSACNPSNGCSSTGNAINAVGQVVGTSTTAQGAQHAFLYTPAKKGMIDLQTPAGGTFSTGQGINASGWVTGESNIRPPAFSGFLYIPGTPPSGTGLVTGFNDLGTLGGPDNYGGLAINANGWVTGESDVAGGDSHAYIYIPGTPLPGTNLVQGMNDLGSLGGAESVGRAINASGQVTGFSWTASFPNVTPHAFLYSDGKMLDLNKLVANDPLAPYVTLTDSTGINDSGCIVANGVDSRTGHYHAYLLSPGGGCALPPGQAYSLTSIGVLYSAQLSHNVVNVSGLPPGLKFNPSNNIISGSITSPV
jgi:probable HAF family extracellular repeat protein